MRSRSSPVVLHVGPVGDVPGGIAQVVRHYLAWSTETLQIRAAPSTRGRRDWRAGLLALRAALDIVALAAENRRGRPALVVTHLSQGGSFYREGALIVLARAVRVPLAVHIHGSGFVRSASRHRAVVKRLIRFASACYVLSDETADFLTARLEVPTAMVHKLVNPVAIPELHRSVRRSGFIFAGVVGARKGVDTLLEAWERINPTIPDWSLTIVGPLEAGFREPHGPRVTWVPGVRHQELLERLVEAEVAVLPSRGEALPMFLLEPMAAGCACIGTAVGDVPALLDQCGLVVEPGDADALCAAMLQLQSRVDLRRSLGEAARVKAIREYSDKSARERLCAAWQNTMREGARNYS